jgi:hypothetical protein
MPDPLMTPRRLRDMARTAPPEPPIAQEPDADDAGLRCPECGASLSLKAVSNRPPAPPAAGRMMGGAVMDEGGEG